MASTLYSSKGRRRARRHSSGSRRWPVWALLLIAVGAALVLFAAVASAAIILHGRGTLTAPAGAESDLQVSDVRLGGPLRPGGAADLILSVRNPNAFGARVDQVTLVGALRKAKPAGCISKVTGPVTRPAGYRLPLADQMLIAAGAKQDVVVRAAFRLAGSAKTGCGFTAVVEVSATQLTPATSPATVDLTTAPTSTATTFPHSVPPSVTVPVTTTPVEMTTPPAPSGVLDCDPDDPTCELGG